MSNIYTEKEMMLAAMISNCRITDTQIQWAIEYHYDELEKQGYEVEYDATYIPTFREIVLACEAKEPPYDLWVP